jgi:hypothetical protein
MRHVGKLLPECCKAKAMQLIPSTQISSFRLMNQYAPVAMTTPPIVLSNAAKFYKELDHQKEAWQWLQARLPSGDLVEFAKLYRRSPPPAFKNPLDVPYFSQRDNLVRTGLQGMF